MQGNVLLNVVGAGIQCSSGARIINNIVVGIRSYGIYISSNSLQVAGGFHDLAIVHNTVYNASQNDLYINVCILYSFTITAYISAVKSRNEWRRKTHLSLSLSRGCSFFRQLSHHRILCSSTMPFFPRAVVLALPSAALVLKEEVLSGPITPTLLEAFLQVVCLLPQKISLFI